MIEEEKWASEQDASLELQLEGDTEEINVTPVKLEVNSVRLVIGSK